MSKAASFNATMNAQALGGGSGPKVVDLESRVDKLERVLGALRTFGPIADAMATAEAEAQVAAEEREAAAQEAAAIAADKAKADQVTRLKAQLAALEADGSIPSPQAVAAGFNPSSGVGGA